MFYLRLLAGSGGQRERERERERQRERNRERERGSPAGLEEVSFPLREGLWEDHVAGSCGQIPKTCWAPSQQPVRRIQNLSYRVTRE